MLTVIKKCSWVMQTLGNVLTLTSNGFFLYSLISSRSIKFTKNLAATLCFLGGIGPCFSDGVNSFSNFFLPFSEWMINGAGAPIVTFLTFLYAPVNQR